MPTQAAIQMAPGEGSDGFERSTQRRTLRQFWKTSQKRPYLSNMQAEYSSKAQEVQLKFMELKGFLWECPSLKA